MKYILITGGAGFVGSCLAEELIKNPDFFVVAVDNFLTGRKENILSASNYKFIKCDVNDYKEITPVMTSFRFNYVFHYAAVVGVKRTLENPLLVLNDIEGFKNILSLSKNTGVEKIYFSSSSEVYGEPVVIPQNEETTPLNSRLPYAIVKNLGEAFIKSYFNEFGLNYTILRFFNTYGPRQSSDFVISKFMNLAIQNKDITVYGDGSQNRTFCYFEDNVKFTRLILEKNYFSQDVINVGSDFNVTIKELAETIIRVTNSKSKIIHLPPLPEGDMNRRLPDLTKMKTVYSKGFIQLEDGIKKIFEYSTSKDLMNA